MDLYLISPVFLRKMLRRSSTTPPNVLENQEDNEDNARPGCEECESEKEMAATIVSYNRDGRRRSSLDRMLRQQAYIIICVLCYACTLPGQGT